jgi:predicted dehydrogenase
MMDYIMKKKDPISRRKFIATTSSALAFTIVPRHILGGVGFIPPSDQIRAACIGVGSQGIRVMIKFLQNSEFKITSVCDVNKQDTNYCEWGPGELRQKIRDFISEPGWGGTQEGCLGGRDPAKYIVEKYYAKENPKGRYKGCNSYRDFRELIDSESDLDAVIIGTPDHAHAIISKTAMENGKHVYCQKPMTHSVLEARKLAEYAKTYNIATQVATGGHASESTRLLCEWIWDGAIGYVREVHNWSSRPFWPQGIDRPKESMPVPENLDWDLWLGPAPFREYHTCYQPFAWRGWKDFGNGAIGDMGCYSFDTIFRVLKLDAPVSVESSGSRSYELEGTITHINTHDETYPRACLINYQFPARGDMPAVKLYWYDGGLKPRRPLELESARQLPEEGLLFVGDKGKILCDFQGGSPRLIPESKMQLYKRPKKYLPRSIGHIEEWVRAVRGGDAADANFGFAGKVTEALLLGNVALNAGEKILWNKEDFKTNSELADKYLHPPYREGWEI